MMDVPNDSSAHQPDKNDEFKSQRTVRPYSPAHLGTEFDDTPKENEWKKDEGGVYSIKSSIEITVFDVAEYILRKCGHMTAMKLQKLVYYCQAWSLVWDEMPLFKERIEAWANGPVIPDLFSYHRGMYELNSILIGNPDLLTPTQKETIDAVLEFYAGKTAQWLIDLSHMEAPWKNARANMSPMERGNKEITHESMAEYYGSL